jgi:hypothetical protein
MATFDCFYRLKTACYNTGHERDAPHAAELEQSGRGIGADGY